MHTDNAREYTSHLFQDTCNALDIIHQTTCLYTPQQNGVDERKNHHLLEVARPLMFQMQVPTLYWQFAFHPRCLNLPHYFPFSIPLNLHFPWHLVFSATSIMSTILVRPWKNWPHVLPNIYLLATLVPKKVVCYSPSHKKLVTSADVTFLETQLFHCSDPPITSVSDLPRPHVPVTNDSPLLPTPSMMPLPLVPPLRVYTRRSTWTVDPWELPSPYDAPLLADPAPTSTAHPRAMSLYIVYLQSSTGLRRLCLLFPPLLFYWMIFNIRDVGLPWMRRWLPYGSIRPGLLSLFLLARHAWVANGSSLSSIVHMGRWKALKLV